jgi:hypothetical protein
MVDRKAVIPDDSTCISLGLPGANDNPTLACQGCINYTDMRLDRPNAKRSTKKGGRTECLYPFLKDENSKEKTKRQTWALINAYLLRDAATHDDSTSTQQKYEAADDESDAVLNDILRDDGGDPQKHAPLCPKVSPDPTALQSLFEEPSPSESVIGDKEVGAANDDIQNLTDAIASGALPSTPMRSPSPPDLPAARAIEDALQSIVEESSPSESVVDDGEEMDIFALAEILSSPGALSSTPLRSPSPKKPSKKKRKYKLGFHSEKVGGVEVQGVPNTYSLVRTQTLAMLMKSNIEVNQLKKTVSGKKFNWNDTARWFIACGLSQIPRASFYALEQFIPCIIAALFVQAGIGGLCFEALANSMPSQATIKHIAFDGAAECLAIQRVRLSKALAVMLGCDKGQRHGVDHLPKYLSFFNLEDDCVEGFCLDNDPTAGTSKGTAEAVAHSLNTKVGKEVLVDLRGQSTDSGGGGTLHSLKAELETLGWVSQYQYFVLPCTIHGWQRALQNAMEGVFGLGGLESRNLLQLVHSCYDLQQCFPGDELSAMWTIAVFREEPLGAEGDTEIGDEWATPNRMSAAVLTRWWYVNTAVVHLLTYWVEWKTLAQKCVNSHRSGTKVNKIASSIRSLMEEPKLRADAEFVKAVSLSLFNPHLLWLQGYDEIVKDVGYRCRNMAERYYLMTEDLNRLRNGGWKKDPAFGDFLAASKKLEVEEDPEISVSVPVATELGHRQITFSPDDCISSADTFFRLFQETCTKHFDTWRNGENAVFMFAGDQDCASALAEWTLSGNLPAENKISQTSRETHGDSSVAINLREYILFVTENQTKELLSATNLVREHGDAVKLLADGESLWNNENEGLRLLAVWCKVNLVPNMSSTHRVEAQVREASLVGISGRDPCMRSAIALLRSTVDKAANKATVQEHKRHNIRRGNQHMSGGVQGQRQVLSSLAKRKRRPNDAGDECSSADPNLIGQTPRGALRTKYLLETTDDFNKTLESRHDRAKYRKELAAVYKSATCRYDQIRIEKKMELLADKMDTQRAPNVIQREVGVDLTPLMKGKIPFSKLNNKEHKAYFIEELRMRNVDGISAATHWNKLCNMMKAATNDDKCWFEPLTPFFKENIDKILSK